MLMYFPFSCTLSSVSVFVFCFLGGLIIVLLLFTVDIWGEALVGRWFSIALSAGDEGCDKGCDCTVVVLLYAKIERGNQCTPYDVIHS
jgi:hypothetical protein